MSREQEFIEMRERGVMQTYPRGLTHEISYLVYDAYRQMGQERSQGEWKNLIARLLEKRIDSAERFKECQEGALGITTSVEREMRKLLTFGW